MFKRPLPPQEAVLPKDLTAILPPPATPETFIAKDVCIIGSLHFQGTLHLEGSFEGDTLSSGTLILAPSGSIIANLKLEEATIFGSVQGNISVRKKLTLKRGAKVEGDISAPILHVEEGVILKGKVEIQEAPSFSSMPDDDDFFSNDN